MPTTKSQITPGPWEVMNGLVYGPDQRLVVMMPRSDRPDAIDNREERQADLVAIAAVPDLIEALRFAHVRALQTPNRDDETINRIESALFKAGVL